MTDHAEQVAFIRVAGNPTEEELGNLYSTLNEQLPEPWGIVVLTDEVEFMDKEEVSAFADDLRHLIGEEHRLANAEPAEQPADLPDPDEAHE